MNERDQREQTQQVEQWFTPREPTKEQTAKLTKINQLGRDLAVAIVKECPANDDRWDAVRDVKRAVNQATAAITAEAMTTSNR